jgi:hypothetical protein
VQELLYLLLPAEKAAEHSRSAAAGLKIDCLLNLPRPGFDMLAPWIGRRRLKSAALSKKQKRWWQQGHKTGPHQ